MVGGGRFADFFTALAFFLLALRDGSANADCFQAGSLSRLEFNTVDNGESSVNILLTLENSQESRRLSVAKAAWMSDRNMTLCNFSSSKFSTTNIRPHMG